ncbi:MAG: PQQ-binding-like beta-propeller repeat protein [Armatimonadetes bacterium]|nr:PQQ-binding-like beta-propeller repeat protein [Armatimonadota bacterium]MDW8121117.1 PQQ-binding-like beta-propeller repeat protein [Armatimonadota bacterium]
MQGLLEEGRDIVKKEMRSWSLLLVHLLISCSVASDDWATIRGDPARTGYRKGIIHQRYNTAWVRHFKDERIGTAVEPIVAEGLVFVATHNGRLYALRDESGEPVWAFVIQGAFLHSPAYADGRVVIGGTDGRVYCLDSKTGQIKWMTSPIAGGFATSPCIVNERIFIGSRSGLFLCLHLKNGKVEWSFSCDGPIMQTAAADSQRVFATDETLHLYGWDQRSGRLLWKSPKLFGQSARDYYPVVVNGSSGRWVIVRTNPAVEMGHRHGDDRSFLCRLAGVDDSDWRNIDAWVRSEESAGSPELWSKEQEAIVAYLKKTPLARSFFIFDRETGKEGPTAPVLWTGGCQGVAALPVVSPEGTVITFHRSAYGNWTLGVAPLIGIGALDIFTSKIQPFFHRHGRQPPWNTFWGTADEAQNIQVVGRTLLFVHQGTLSAFDLDSGSLWTLWGDRDSWGGFRNLPWAQNEWHGPARGGVAIVKDRIYWITGSRILCLSPDASSPAPDIGWELQNFKTVSTAPVSLPSDQTLREELEEGVRQLITNNWAPLIIEPGLAGRWLLYDNSADLIEALAWAFPHLSASLKKEVLAFVAELVQKHNPLNATCWLELSRGQRREHFWLPDELIKQSPGERPHPFGNFYAVSLFVRRSNDRQLLDMVQPFIAQSFQQFVASVRPHSAKDLLFMNRYINSLVALKELKDSVPGLSASEIDGHLQRWTETLISVWKKAGEESRLRVFSGIQEWDQRIAWGEPFLVAVRPHRARWSLFADVNPPTAALLLQHSFEPVQKVWSVFSALCPTWHIVGGERQIHYGENFIDPPDFALSAFRFLAFVLKANKEELKKRWDLAFCPADLCHIIKVSLVLETGR